ncbi:MAG TPA: glutamine synthetase family protein, partial [Candidatus Ozemobacteraceae bacterium]|nr:glutamine synthetase family protein [Candidatus Ozemobacteraceae bacterium]
MNEQIALNPNKLVRFLDKSSNDFTKKDLIHFIEKNDIRMVNFRYVGGDGKLKLLNFIINDKKYLDKILSVGERVDGSSLFSYVEASASDLYVVPRYRTAFVNPFAQIPTVDILCSYFDKTGQPLNIAPENILKKAHASLKEKTGMQLQALGELEFYLSSELDKIYTITPQKGYHESHPFAKWEMVRIEAMNLISEMGGRIKYGHSEVGNIVSGDWEYVQHEIEFLPVDVEDAADQLVVAKWAIREVAYKHGLEVSFAPKIIVGHAGSGLHIHARLVKDGRNQMVDETGSLSLTARKMIGGLLELAPSITAFGNVV